MSISDIGPDDGAKTGKKYFYLNLAVCSMIFSYHLLISSQVPANNGKDILLYLISGNFAAWFCILSSAMFASMAWLSVSLGFDRDIPKDKRIFQALLLLLVLGIGLTFLRNIDRGWHAIFNCIFAMALGLLYYRLGIFKGMDVKPGEKWPFYLLCIASFIFIILAAAGGFSLQNSYSTFPKDMGLFTNLIWRIGLDGFQFTIIEDFNDHRGVHFQPVLYLLALIFKIKCSPYILIFLQVFFSLGASVFLYLFTERLLKNKGAAFFLALAFLTSTYTARTFIYDYHPESMYIMMFFAFIYFAERGIFPAAAAFLCLAAGVKEEAAVYMSLASMYMFIINRDKKYLVLSIGSMLYAAAVVFVVMPAYGAGAGGWVDSLIKNFANLLNPGLGWALFIQFCIFLLGAAFLPVFSLNSLLLIFLPPVLVHFANYRDPSHLLFNMWYASFVTPALFVSAVYALDKKARNNAVIHEHLVLAAFLVFVLQAELHLAFMSEFSPLYSAAVCAITMVFIIFPFSPAVKNQKAVFSVFVLAALAVFYFGYYNFQKSRMGDVPEAAKSSIKKAMEFIPASEDTAVLTNQNIVNHICCRKYIWALDSGTAEEVILPILRENLKSFYMLVYLYDFTYPDNKIAPDVRNREIASLAKQNGFSYGFLYNDNITGVLIFTRP